eukprot:gb/GEZN01007218.1/.p1 GENE.gb/GEZN01007218.1/~~gb/GEZN01007218.1/.p1  ORF type:complete len:443 (-),score=37.50 gb/GEZN01007218.1/:167-1495(-)
MQAINLNLCVKCDWPKKETFLKVEGSCTVTELTHLIEQEFDMKLDAYSFIAVPYMSDTIDLLADNSIGENSENAGSNEKGLHDLKVTDRSTIFAFAPNKHLQNSLRATTKQDSEDPFPALTVENVLDHLALLKGKQKKRALEIVEMYTQDVVESKAWLQIDAKLLSTILRSPKLNIKEADLFTALIKWGEAEAEREGGGVTMQTVIEKHLKHIRFPCMTSEEVATQVSGQGILSETIILALFTYLGTNQIGKAGLLPPSLKQYSATPRVAREPPAWFKWSTSLRRTVLQLCKDDSVASCSGNSHHAVLGDTELTTGKHRWKLVVDALYANAFAAVIGVADCSNPSIWQWTSSHMLGSAGQLPGWGWSIYSSDLRSSTGKKGKYGAPRVKVKDVIKVYLDLDAGTLEFFVNDKSRGVAFTDVVGPVRPAISLYGNTTQLSLQF